jgi:hypothetical protein
MFMPSQARARSAVLKAIQRAELKFSETAPAFTKHLTENLRFHRGRWAYKPHETIRWVVPEKLR